MSFYRRRSDPMLPHRIARKYLYIRWFEQHYLRVSITKVALGVELCRYFTEDPLHREHYYFQEYPECAGFHDGVAWDVLSVVSFIHFNFRPDFKGKN